MGGVGWAAEGEGVGGQAGWGLGWGERCCCSLARSPPPHTPLSPLPTHPSHPPHTTPSQTPLANPPHNPPLSVADDEARHLGWCLQRLQELGHAYGCMPAHNLLWEGAALSAGDVCARLAVVPLSQVGGGVVVGWVMGGWVGGWVGAWLAGGEGLLHSCTPLSNQRAPSWTCPACILPPSTPTPGLVCAGGAGTGRRGAAGRAAGGVGGQCLGGAGGAHCS